MESKDKVELLQIAIKQLIEEEKVKNMKGSSSDESFIALCGDGDDAADYHLLSKLLSQLEMLKEDGMPDGNKPSSDINKVDSSEAGEKSETTKEASGSNSQPWQEEIIQELKQVKRQNFITHCLLSAMIVLTVAWQLSEVSFILTLKEGFSNPLKFLGGMITGMLKGPRVTRQDVEKLASAAKQKPILAVSALPIPGLRIPVLPSALPIPGLRIPVLPRVELPVFDLDDEEG